LDSLVSPVVQPIALTVPERFSYSSLHQIRECPRRWQLVHARYEDRVGYPETFSPAAERGRLIHRLLRLLFQTMATAGNPAPGSKAFQAAARALNPLGRAALLHEEAQRNLEAHPRRRGQQLRFTPLEIYSAATLLFQREYASVSSNQRQKSENGPQVECSSRTALSGAHEPLAQRLARWGSLSEKSLVHPTLPLHGIVDLLLQSPQGAIIVDFKTGSPKPSHNEQIQLYALLWWRQEGHLPARGEVRYGSQIEEVDVQEATLLRLETSLTEELSAHVAALATDAIATPGEHCKFCPVRPLCARYWEAPVPTTGEVDAEILIGGEDSLGFQGSLPHGQLIRVLLPPAKERLRTVLKAGSLTRWLGLRREESSSTLECTEQTEIFVVHSPLD
jgi:hypothetical protein